MKRWSVCGVLLSGLLLAGCSEVGSAVDQANNAKDRASACGEALGLANVDPNLDPAQLQAEADQRAKRLKELGNQVADQGLKQSFYDMSNSLAEVGQKAEGGLANLPDVIQRNTQRLDQLRKACL
jgi:hypothetical protein